MQQTSNNDTEHKRSPLSWVPSVYFGMGLPYISISVVALLMFQDFQISKTEIATWTSLLIVPWSLKPFFSLVMGLFGTKRQYVILTEAITALMFGFLTFSLIPSIGLGTGSMWFGIAVALMGVMAVSGSMHDIAGDGIYMHELSSSEQGQWSGWQGAFYNLAKILCNGGLVYLAGYLSKTFGLQLGKEQGLQMAWLCIMAISGILMLGLALYHFLSLPKEKPQAKNHTAEGSTQRLYIDKRSTGTQKKFKEAMAEMGVMIVSFFQKPHIWLYLAFIFVYRFTEGLAMKMAPIFLKDAIETGGIGLSNQSYGLIYGTAGTIAFIVGSILSGYCIGHFGLKRILSTLVIVFNSTFAVYLLLAIYQPSDLWWIASGIIFEYFCYGFGFVGITLFMMQQIAPGKYQMAHYAFANSLMNLSVLVPGAISGWLCEWLGYKTFFLVALLSAIPVVLMSFFLPFAHKTEQDEVEA